MKQKEERKELRRDAKTGGEKGQEYRPRNEKGLPR